MVLFLFPICNGHLTTIERGFKASSFDDPSLPSISTQNQGFGDRLVECKASTSEAPRERAPSQISTEKYVPGEIEIVSKSYKPAISKRKRRKSISTKPHPTTIKKEEGKKLLLTFVSYGMTLPTAIRVICLLKGYKSRTTIYKWLEDEEFAEEVYSAEIAIFGVFEMLEFQLAQGGQLLSVTEEHEYREKVTDRRKEMVERTRLCKRWKPPNATAVLKGLERRLARLKRIEQAEDKAKALMEID